MSLAPFPAFPPAAVQAARAAAAIFWRPYAPAAGLLAAEALSERQRVRITAQVLIFWALAGSDWIQRILPVQEQLKRERASAAGAATAPEPWVEESALADTSLALLSLFHPWLADEEFLMLETFLAEPRLIIGRTVAPEQLLTQWLRDCVAAALTALCRSLGEPDALLTAEARAFQDSAEKIVWLPGGKHLTERELAARLGVQRL
jgi:hypothetical protein